MIASDLENPYIMPSPGHTGAFQCAICGRSQIAVGILHDEQIVIRLSCTCGNYLDFYLPKGN